MARDLSFSLTCANIIGTALILPLAGLGAAPFLYTHGPGAAVLGGWSDVWVVTGLTLVGVVVHELIHAWGFVRFAGLKRSDVRMGINWKAVSPYVHVDKPVSVAAYRSALVLPAVVLGAVPCLVAAATGSAVALWVGVIMLVTAAGDLLVLYTLRSARRTDSVLDHPSRAGCTLVQD